MRWGLNQYDLMRIPVKKVCKIYYIRWYYNGWHYWAFLPGRVSTITDGEEYRTIGTKKISMGSGQITRGQCTAIRTIMNTREVALYTIAGWMNIRIEPGTVNIYDNQLNGNEIEFIAVIGSKDISYTDGYSPVGFVPEVQAGTTYCEVIIGDQVWMCYNYDTNYPGSKVYNDDEANRSLYGGLYTFDQINNPGFCPEGWHVPTLTEWQTLIDFAGGDAVAGDILKSVGFTYWLIPNTGADTYGFGVRGSGYYNIMVGFMGLNYYTKLWTATDLYAGTGENIQMAYNSAAIIINSEDHQHFCPVRLIKDTPAPPNIIYAGTTPNSYILRSLDLGLTFSNLGSSGHGNPTCFVKLLNGNILYGTDTGWIVNHFLGTSFNTGVNKITSIAQSPLTGDILAGNLAGNGYVSYDNGVTFLLFFALGSQINKVLLIREETTDRFIVFHAGGIFTNGYPVQAGNFTCAEDIGGGVIYSGDNAGHLWKSVSYGETWSDLGVVSVGVFTSLIYSGGRLLFTYAATFSIGYTDDEGATHTWVNTAVDVPTNLVYVESNILLGGTSNGKIYKSMDNGTSWSEIAGNPQFGETSINAMLKT